MLNFLLDFRFALGSKAGTQGKARGRRGLCCGHGGSVRRVAVLAVELCAVQSRLQRNSELISRIRYKNRGVGCDPRVVPAL